MIGKSRPLAVSKCFPSKDIWCQFSSVWSLALLTFPHEIVNWSLNCRSSSEFCWDWMEMFRIKAAAVWMGLFACFCLTVVSGAGLAVCYAKDGHTMVESLNTFFCQLDSASNSPVPGDAAQEHAALSLFEEECCGPCLDVFLTGNRVFSTPISHRHLLASPQPLLLGPASLTSSADARSAKCTGWTSSLSFPDRCLSSLRTTILLI